MPATPMDIRLRPYSVEPFTKVMLPDGIFDTALFSQEITCHYTNESAATLHNVTIYLEGVGENGGDKLVHGSGGISQPRAE